MHQNPSSVSFIVYLTNIFFMKIALYIVAVFICGSLFYINISLAQRVEVQAQLTFTKISMSLLQIHWSTGQATLEQKQISLLRHGYVKLSDSRRLSFVFLRTNRSSSSSDSKILRHTKSKGHVLSYYKKIIPSCYWKVLSGTVYTKTNTCAHRLLFLFDNSPLNMQNQF